MAVETLCSEIDFHIRLMTDADYENMSAFSCGEPKLDIFFRKEIKECVERHYLAGYAVISSEGEIIAAFTLMNDALMIESGSEKDDFIDDVRFETESDVVDFFKLQSSYPAINIGHLGTIISHQCKGIGSAIIELVANTFQEYKQAGCQFITVDALNNGRTIKFYLSAGFNFQTNKDLYASTRRMYRILN